MEQYNTKILIADDEPDIIEFLQYNLENEGYHVVTAANGEEAIKVAQKEMPDLIILDIMMPGMDGVEVCRELRSMAAFKSTLIAFLTARSEDYSQIAGFDVGADEYITKPVRPRVFLARVKALLKRKHSAVESNTLIQTGGITIDKEKILVQKGDETIHLPKKEFELLALLTSKPGKVFTREEIYDKVWGNELVVGDRTIDVHIRKLREKIGEDTIKTLKGVGYKFVGD